MRGIAVALALVYATASSTFAQSIAGDSPRVRIRLTSVDGQRVAGYARSLKDGVLEFTTGGDGGSTTLVDVHSINLIERGSRRTPRMVAAAAGAGVGLAGFVFGLFGGLAWCNDESTTGGCWGVMEAIMFVGAPVLGGLTGWLLGRTRWTPITSDELQSELTQLAYLDAYSNGPTAMY